MAGSCSRADVAGIGNRKRPWTASPHSSLSRATVGGRDMKPWPGRRSRRSPLSSCCLEPNPSLIDRHPASIKNMQSPLAGFPASPPILVTRNPPYVLRCRGSGRAPRPRPDGRWISARPHRLARRRDGPFDHDRPLGDGCAARLDPGPTACRRRHGDIGPRLRSAGRRGSCGSASRTSRHRCRARRGTRPLSPSWYRDTSPLRSTARPLGPFFLRCSNSAFRRLPWHTRRCTSGWAATGPPMPCRR